MTTIPKSSGLERSTQQAVRDGSDDRRTPRALFDPLHARYRFTFDAAASDANHLCADYATSQTDGLLVSWAGRRVWCNPPFSKPEAWVAKAWAEMRGACELVVMLLPANRCEQAWWHAYVEPYRDRPLSEGLALGVALRTQFIRGRTSFTSPDKVVRGAPPFGCVLLIWSREP